MVCEFAVQQNLVNMKDNWKPKNWQGKSKKSVEDSYEAVFYGMAMLFAIVVLAIIVNQFA